MVQAASHGGIVTAAAPGGPGAEGGRPSLRARLVAPARRVVAGSTDRRFDAVERELAESHRQLELLHRSVAETFTEVLALRQQAEETLAYLRVQHDVVRDVLEEVRPTVPRSGQHH